MIFLGFIKFVLCVRGVSGSKRSFMVTATVYRELLRQNASAFSGGGGGGGGGG